MRTIVVGAGIAGLAAARDLRVAGHDVLVLEAAPQVGGKLRRAEVGGVTVDVGAEAMLARRPEGPALARELGLEVVHPTTASSRIWTRGALRPLPRTMMGVPLDLDQLEATGILSPEGMTRARARVDADRTEGDGREDLSVGDLVAGRFGDEVVDRLVEPLLGGVYAGHARGISVRAAVPQLAALLAPGFGPLATPAPPPADPGVPVFGGLPGGMGALPGALARGLDVRVGTTVRELRRTGAGFELVVGATTAEERLGADAVVLATPAAPAARLLTDLAPAAAAELAGIDYASMAVVTLAVRATEAPDLAATGASGFLVPPVDGRRIKAATFSFAKWGWVREAGRGAGGAADDLLLLRASMGRLGEEQTLQRDDAELVGDVLADLHDAVGLTARPVDTHVQRWGGGLPQYAVGHVERVARIRRAVAEVPGLVVCGAAYDGVGIAGCLASAHRAAEEVARGMMAT